MMCWLAFITFLSLLSIQVDGTFCQAALVGKIQIKEQLPKYFAGEVQLGELGHPYHAGLIPIPNLC